MAPICLSVEQDIPENVINNSSPQEMLDFNRDASGFTTGYGLGAHLFKKDITNGEVVYGHSGGNIGTTSYMAFLPDYRISIAISINSMHDKCPGRILKEIIRIVTSEVRPH